jgi:hypothetical protein
MGRPSVSVDRNMGLPRGCVVSGNDFMVMTIMILILLFVLLNLGPLIFF